MVSSDNPLARQLLSWRKGIHYELSFWRRWMETRGLQWPDDFNRRFAGGYDMSWLLAESGCGTDNCVPVVVDVGSGPVTTFGQEIRAGLHARVHAVDPLARQYNGLLDTCSLMPPVRTEFGIAEDLSSYFDRDYADLVHCNNALDHSFDPLRSIEEMLQIVTPAGLVFLRHRRNEAELESYSGFHQWNFDVQDGAFIIWNRENATNVKAYIDRFASCAATLDGDFVLIRLRKHACSGPALDSMVADRRRGRLSMLYELLIDAAATATGG
jgi:SAM-dependent methyltransferase